MYGEVKKLFDVQDLPIPAEYLDTSVTAEEVAAHHGYLAAAYSTQTPAEKVQTGDWAVCVCQDGSLAGRTVPLYPGKGFPQATEAEQAVLGRQVGETFSTRIGGAPCTLTVEQVTRCIPAAVDDRLIAGLGLTGITTVDAYDAWYRKQVCARKKEEKGKTLGRYLLRELTARCEFSYDQAAVTAQMEKEYARLRDQGQTLTLAEYEPMFLEQLNQNLVLTQVCRQQGIQVTEDDVRGNVDQMLEMYSLMGETAPDRESLIREYIQAEYYTRGMALLLRTVRGEAEP